MAFMRIIFLLGQSGTGKDTICSQILKYNTGIKRYTYCTTRPMRHGEKEGREYFFKTGADYDSDKASGRVIESRIYDFYDTSTHKIRVAYYSCAKEIDGNTYIVTGTPDMCKSFIKYYGRKIVQPIFIYTEESERLVRCIKRESENKKNYKEVIRRFYDEFTEYSWENLKGFKNIPVILNGVLENCISAVNWAITHYKAASINMRLQDVFSDGQIASVKESDEIEKILYAEFYERNVGLPAVFTMAYKYNGHRHRNLWTWKRLSYYSLPESFMLKYADKLDWARVIKNHKLSGDFLEKLYETYIATLREDLQYDLFDIIVKSQCLTEEFLQCHVNDVNWEYVREYQNIA